VNFATGLPAIVFSGLSATGAWYDARLRTIPNGLNVAMAILGIAAVLLTAGGSDALSAAGHFLAALIGAMVLYTLKLWGGGDAKFYAATAAWFPLRDAPRLMIAVALAGLVLASAWFLLKRWRRNEPAEVKSQLPYGLAIAAGGILTMGLNVSGVA
jgi:prepilin peptidase CpaA